MSTPRLTVLLVDDDPEQREQFGQILADASYDVVGAHDGRAALHYLTSPVPPPSLIVTDLSMPDMSGWEFINVLQAYTRLSQIPLVVVTGFETHRERLKRDVVAEYVQKPIAPQGFLELVKRHARPNPDGRASSQAITQKLPPVD